MKYINDNSQHEKQSVNPFPQLKGCNATAGMFLLLKRFNGH